MTTVNDLNELNKFLNKAFKQAFEMDMAEVTKQKQSENVKNIVYDRYTSQEPYVQRRNGNDGLADKRNMKSTVTQNSNSTTLEVQNIADGNPNATYTTLTNPDGWLAGIIEKGRLPDRKGLYTRNATDTQDEYLAPRPFIDETRKDLENGLAIDTLKKALKKQGLDVQ